MFGFLWLWFGVGAVTRFFRSRQNLLLENLALRQQITVLKRRHPRPKLSPLDKSAGCSRASFSPLRRLAMRCRACGQHDQTALYGRLIDSGGRAPGERRVRDAQPQPKPLERGMAQWSASSSRFNPFYFYVLSLEYPQTISSSI